jgi:hypothetical protein
MTFVLLTGFSLGCIIGSYIEKERGKIMAGLWTVDIDWDEDSEPWDVVDNLPHPWSGEVEPDPEDDDVIEEDEEWGEDEDLDTIAVTYPELG